ncbi:PH-response transcription factor isoform X2 [Tasmannia lanceolata]|uniref:PH-response transcription factor isoform X2 n=1 Tax=Tasmannia lanceolata TaxID=3420 RepID=UPI004063B61C
MLPKPSGVSDFDLPETVLAVLPSDPFEQLDVARKITSIALATRVSKLESEASRLRQKVAEKEQLIDELQAQIENLDISLAETSDQLAQAHDERESLLNENASLSNTVKKLNRDVSKLEVFRKTLMQSLQEEEEGSQTGAPRVGAKTISNNTGFSSGSLAGEDATLPSMRTSSVRSKFSETSFSEDARSVESDASKHGSSHGFLLASGSSSRLTPPDSPPRFSASVSPTITSKPESPRRHSISLSTTRNMFDDRSSIFSSMSPSHHSSMSGSLETGSQTGRSRVNGKEFFRQVRSRLSYEQFGAFLASVKDLNSHKQTREETLRRADDIFGPDNKDLYTIFEGLITRNLH